MKLFLKILAVFLFSCIFVACSEQNDSVSLDQSTAVSVYVPAEPSDIPELSEFSLLEETYASSEPWEESSALSESSEECDSSGNEETSSPIESEPQEESTPGSETSESSQPPEISQEPEDPKPHKVNGFIVYGDRGMEPFGGSAKGGKYTAEVFNLFKERVGEHVNVYAMPIPLACTFYAPEGYEKSISCMTDCFYGLRDALVDVEFVDLITALNKHSDEDIYARTDHHWMALGAYYASKELCKVAGVDFDTIDQFTKCSFDGFLGSVVTAYDVRELRKYPEAFTWYEPLREYTAHYYEQDYRYSFSGSIFSPAKSYVKFIYGDSYIVRIETGVKNGRKMLIVKDSFGNALAPFLLAGFEEVYVVDYRDCECNILEFIRENEITDVTLSLSAFAVASSKRDNIIKLMEQ